MAKHFSPWKFWLPLLTIAVVSLLISGGVLAASYTGGFGASVLQPIPIENGQGFKFGLFRTRFCGNAKLEYREQCDDGNRRNGDGCSRMCRKEGRAACAGHALGENFLGPDGCNRCTCTENGMACTKMYCPPKSSSSSASSQPQACGASTQCPAGHYCTTADGDCRSACPPGAQMCTQVCMGVCRRNECKPYVCPDGTRHPSCSEDGHVINYFADPCLTRQ